MTNLRSWKTALRRAIDDSWEYDVDFKQPDCLRCGNTMDFHGHDDLGEFPIGEGYWECPDCGFKVTENDI